MFYIQNSAIILAPTAAYEEWLLSENILKLLPDATREELQTMNLDGLRANATVMATPAIKKDIESELNEFVAKNADIILAAEFDRRGLDITAKPFQSASDLLKVWFDISYHRFVFGVTDPI